MINQQLLSPAEEMDLLREVLAAEGDDDRRAYISESMLMLHRQEQRAKTS